MNKSKFREQIMRIKTHHLLFFFILLILLTSCKQRSVRNENVATIDLLNITKIADSLNNYIGDIKVIRLHGKDSLAIVSPNKLLINNDNIIALSAGKVIDFNEDGKFVRYIGRIGRGSGEYVHILDFCINFSKTELFCLDTHNNLLRYDLTDGTYLGEVTTDLKGITATSVLPLEDNGFALFVANPSQSQISDFDNGFCCLKSFDSKGNLIDEQLERTDFNISPGIVNQSNQCENNSYILSYRPGSGICYQSKKGRIFPYANLSFGKRSIPYRIAVQKGGDPWNMIGNIFTSDYYKCPSAVCYSSDVVYCAAFGKNSSLWNFIFDRSFTSGIRWRSYGNGAAPMAALAADKDYIFFSYSETNQSDPSETEDLLQRILISKYHLVLHDYDNPVIIGVKFKLR
ncbi:MAG: 6-bladed beta-propeller [Bacteroidales bacterium]|jgi:hypothetical protein|nr:6-bladed beta-propeller [Bacteroidales bacterium]